MKKIFILTFVCLFLSINYAEAQLSKFVKNVSKDVQNQLLGGKNDSGKSTQPEPSCACSQPDLILDLGGKLKVDYSEITITSGDDGSILVQDRTTQNYYIAKDGATKGPYTKGNPALGAYGITKDEDSETSKGKDFTLLYKDFVFKTGDKYTIVFNGKKYGPYALINQFVVTKSRDKFAAIVTEIIAVTEEMSKKMEAESKKAKTQEEQMALAAKYSQEMMANMEGKDPMSQLPKLVSSVPDANVESLSAMSGQLKSDFKYDDILVYRYDKITDLKGNTIITTPQGGVASNNFYISSDNSKYATYDYGTLTFSDKKTLSDLFNVHWLKASDGKIYLAYMYYSPKKNSIMQCKIPF
jgi:hypothetical protein